MQQDVAVGSCARGRPGAWSGCGGECVRAGESATISRSWGYLSCAGGGVEVRAGRITSGSVTSTTGADPLSKSGAGLGSTHETEGELQSRVEANGCAKGARRREEVRGDGGGGGGCRGGAVEARSRACGLWW